MAAFKAKDRQRIIDGYLAASGANMFIPAEFVDWLQGQPDHEAYPWFFDKSDAEAAREYRIGLARQMASGLRIVAKVEEIRGTVMQITTHEYPAYVSPVSGRRSGGGYAPVNVDDPEHLAEIRRQGCSALRGWLQRYRGAFEMAGIDLSPLEEIASSEDADIARIA